MVYDPASPRRPGRRTRSSTRSSPTASATGARNNDPQDRRRPLRRPGARAAVGHAARGLLPQLRGRRAPTARGASTRRRPADSPTKEQPRGRDYFGGDLKGVDQQLDYLESLGVNDDLLQPDLRRRLQPRLRHPGLLRRSTRTSARRRTGRTWSSTPSSAGMRIVLDGVFNHLSSDSPFFDRYHHYSTVGACESPSSPYRVVVHLPRCRRRAPAPAPAAAAPNSATYDGWFGFDSIPVLNKSQPGRPGVLPDRPGQRRAALARRRARPAGAWT